MPANENSQPLPVVHIGETPLPHEANAQRWLVDELRGVSSVVVIDVPQLFEDLAGSRHCT